MTRYGFRQALGGFFLADTASIRSVLPKTLFPVEARPGYAVLAINAFEFDETEVGPYGELVLSVLVPPYARAGQSLPFAAYFPFGLATSTEASRAHATERWRLPQYRNCLDIAFDRSEQGRQVIVRDGDASVMRLSVGHSRSTTATRPYQCFSQDDSGLYRVGISIQGDYDEHEEELGSLDLADHDFTTHFAAALDDDIPFREQSIDRGEQRFGDLIAHAQDAS